MPVSEATYRQLSLEDDDTTWELVCGRLREKPPMTMEHNRAAGRLHVLIQNALGWDEYEVAQNSARTRLPDGQYVVPDVAVIPVAVRRRFRETPEMLEEYAEPLPLIVEVRSPSTGRYDAGAKLEGYKARGDLEIWLIHPQEQTLTAHRRQDDGTYRTESYSRGDSVTSQSIPRLQVSLSTLFS